MTAQRKDAKAPIDRTLDAVDWRCTNCNARRGTCDCWTECPRCGWSYRKGKTCRNPNCSEVSRG